MEHKIPAFGGAQDGKPFHMHADPPFGYWTKQIEFRGKKRKLFIMNHIRAEQLDMSILKKCLSNVDDGVKDA